MAVFKSGIRISEAGVSVPYAADYQFIFNSDWPSLQIAFEAVVTVASFDSKVLNHNLGFFPFTVVWDVTNGINSGRVTQGISFDKSNVTLFNVTGSDMTFSLKCYNLDITSEKSYVLPTFPVLKRVYDPTVGIKVCKYGKSIESRDLRDFILHSRAQSPAILNVITTPTSANTISFTNPAGYIPWAFAFATTTGANYSIVNPGPTQAPPSFNFSSPGNGKVVLQYTALPKSKGSLVILRDPLVVANTVQVTY